MGNKHTTKPKKSRGNAFNLRPLSNLKAPPPPCAFPCGRYESSLAFSKTQFIVCFWSSQIGHWVCGKKLNFLALRVIQLFTNPKKKLFLGKTKFNFSQNTKNIRVVVKRSS